MSFPVETVDGETVLIETKITDANGSVTLIAEDGRAFEPSMDALLVQLKEVGAAAGKLADKASEALGEVAEAAKEVADEVGDVIEAGGDVIEAVLDDPVEAVKDVIDFLDGEDG